MSIPTPSAIAPLLTQRKQQQMHDAEQPKSMPQKPDRSAKRDSKVSRSSRQDKAPATSSKSRQKPRSTRTTSSNTESASSTETTPAVKKPFVRKEHLTQRLSTNEQLKELRDSMTTPRHPNRTDQKPRRKSQTRKTTNSTSNAK